jgi:hypothetical protein
MLRATADVFDADQFAGIARFGGASKRILIAGRR